MITKTWNRVCCQIKNPKIAFLVICVFAFSFSAVATVLPAMTTTIEKRFDFTTSEVSWLMTGNDIGYLSFVLFAAYYGGRGNQVRVLVLSAIGLGLFGYVMAMPYFIFGNRYDPEEMIGASHGNSSSTKRLSGLTLAAACEAKHRNKTTENINWHSDVAHQKIPTIVLQMFGGVVSGIAVSPFWSVGISFIDDIMGKRSGAYLGLLYAIRALSPIVGFAYAAFLNTLNESLRFFVQSFPGGQQDPSWIGAWWMGFILLGSSVLLTAPCVALFNRKAMIDRTKKAERENRKENDEQIVNDPRNSEDAKETKPAKKMGIKDLIKVLQGFATNPAFVCFAFGNLLSGVGELGFGTFYPKFIEQHFRLPASQANLMFSIIGAVTAVVSTLMSGFITQKFPMSPKKTNLYKAVTNFMGVMLFPFLLILACPTVPISGSDNKSPDFDCAEKNCSCPLVYSPVCAEGQNYFNPCQAGCNSFNTSASLYMDCLCKNVTAVPGVCRGACHFTYWYGALSFVIRLIPGLNAVQSTQVLMAFGDDDTKPFGIAAMGFLTGIMGIILPPVIGKLITSMCLIQNPSRTGQSFCVLYNVDKMRVTLHMFWFVPNFLGAILFFISWYKMPKEVGADLKHDDIKPETDTIHENKAYAGNSDYVTTL